MPSPVLDPTSTPPRPLLESSSSEAHEGTPEVSQTGFDVSRHIALAPMFRESEVKWIPISLCLDVC